MTTDHTPDMQVRLTGGDPRSIAGVAEVVELLAREPVRVGELVACVLETDDLIIRMRAADALEKVCRAAPDVVQPYVETILDAISLIDQPSVMWHVAQMLDEVDLSDSQLQRAVAIVRANLERSDDWIVLNCSLQTLASFARRDASLGVVVREQIARFLQDRRRSLASRARKLQREFG